jgi:hypothetical protein
VAVAGLVVVAGVQLPRSLRSDGGSALMKSLPSADRAGNASVAATAAGGASGESAAGPLPSGLEGPKVVKTGTVDIEVAKGRFGGAFERVSTIAAANGGFVASSSSNRGDGDGRLSAGSLVVRVPADRFDAARAQLARLGKVRSASLEGEDVGGRSADLDARLRNLRSQEETIRQLMERATTVGETIDVQRQLFAVREQIEQLAAQQARLADAVALSTITVALAEPGGGFDAPDRTTLGDALARAVEGAERVVAAAIVVAGYLFPLGLLLAAGLLLNRVVRRRPPALPAGS